MAVSTPDFCPPDPPAQAPRTLPAYLVPCLTSLICVGLALGGETWRLWGRYERAGIEAGQWWRLVSGHLVHLGWSHLVLNLAALWMLVALMRAPLTMLEWLAVLASSVLLIDLGLYVADATVSWYVGLSGVLHGLAIMVAARLWWTDRWSSGLLSIALAGKLVAEQLFGASSWSIAASGGPVVVAAHGYGALGGLLALALLRGLAAHYPDILSAPRMKR